jgi:hypothetical protein
MVIRHADAGVLVDSSTSPGRQELDAEPIVLVADLDGLERDDAPGRRGRGLARPRFGVLALLGTLLLGAAAGVAGGQRWQATRDQTAADTTAGLVLVVEAAPPFTERYEQRQVHLRQGVFVVNTLPAAVEVTAVRSRQDAVDLRLTTPPGGLVNSGVAQRMEIELSVSCSTGAPTEPVPVELAVRTAPDVGRSQTLRLQRVLILSVAQYKERVERNCR